MATFVNSFFEKRVEQLLELAEQVDKAFSSSSIEYRVVGGLAAYLYVEEVDPDAGRPGISTSLSSGRIFRGSRRR